MLEHELMRLGRQWANDSDRKRIKPLVCQAWAKLLDEWIADESLPLMIRKSSAVRGAELTHKTGRKLIPTDNTPAQWVCYLALQDQILTLDQIRSLISNKEIPASFAHIKSQEGSRVYNAVLGKFSINKLGQKLCHIEPVGLKSRQRLEDIEIDVLKGAFKRLLDPHNYFLLDMKYGGLGEVQAFIDGFRQALV